MNCEILVKVFGVRGLWATNADGTDLAVELKKPCDLVLDRHNSPFLCGGGLLVGLVRPNAMGPMDRRPIWH